MSIHGKNKGIFFTQQRENEQDEEERKNKIYVVEMSV